MSEDARIQSAAKPMLYHPDLNMRNIFVQEDDPTVLTGIIDWQSASIEPAFWYSDTVPDFARTEVDAAGEVDPRSEFDSKAFEASVQFLLPKLAYPMSLNESLFRPFRYCHRTWKDGAVAFHDELIETSKQWSELGLEGSCPFTLPTSDELVTHRRLYQKFVAAQELKRDLSKLMNAATDGWVPPEAWESTLVEHKEMHEGMLAEVLSCEDLDEDEPVRNERDLREIWPFDLNLLP
jgi:hypothetical protein